MKGARALTAEEIQSIKKSFFGAYEVRDRTLFLIGLYTGARISELVSLNLGDVYQHGKVVKDPGTQEGYNQGQEGAADSPEYRGTGNHRKPD